MKKKWTSVVAVGLAMTLGACAAGPVSDTVGQDDNVNMVEDPTAPGDAQDVSGGFAVEGGISVADALKYEGDQPVAVQGYLVLVAGSANLCSILAESFPPQCGGDRLVITNSEATSGAALIEEGDVQWSEEPVTVFGEVSGDHFTIDSTIAG